MSHRTVSVLASLLIALSCMILLGGCNTMEGAGKDIERTGEAIQDAAD